ncbi:hypothetical protein IW261DRAFT_1443808 [Armillaria novae-zelandiae]|uniref:Uncharacterized protein n=1 Tax=Armillaria novae-zelandiae TaxID=153914 RepID=A0AA39PRJ6_9AGAR|nr:hypothetical protein IW261DRAFT_1443808 [Armillaria novae-zelandiae]
MSSDSEQALDASSFTSDSDVELTSVGNPNASKKRKSIDSSENKALSVAKTKKFNLLWPSSDIEDDIPYDPVNPYVFGRGTYTPHQKPLDSASAQSKSLFSEDEDPQPKNKSTAPLKPKTSTLAKQRSKPKLKPAEDTAQGSGDSNAENDPPVTQRRRAIKDKKKPSDKDEATIKRLKSLVLACGVRKPWAKLFEGVDRPSQQIKIIKDILAELGMKGRMSMEQAKAIREKREMEQELGMWYRPHSSSSSKSFAFLADVQLFEKSFVSRSSRSQATAKKAAESDQEDSDEEMAKKACEAETRQSIMAFLGDESD